MIEQTDTAAGQLGSWLLDWRFLLPDARIGRTLVLGRAPHRRVAMLNALRAVGDQFSSSDEAAAGSVDGAVLFGLKEELLARAARSIRAGGWVYVEAGPLRLPRRPASIADRLHRSGFTRVRLYWHWPSFEACTEMVPLNDRASVLSSLARRRSRRGLAGLVYGGAAWLVRAGTFPILAPHVSVVATRGSER